MIKGVKMEKVKLGNVKLTDGLFKERERVDRNYLMELDNRALLQNFYMEAGIILPGLQIVPDPSDTYMHWGWEAPTCQLRGHFLGHWMSAAALLVANYDDVELRAKLTVIVDELEKCQIANGGKWIGSVPEKYFKRLETHDYIWSPQYTVHKTLMGLIDTYEYAGIKKAYDIFSNAADWYVEWANRLEDKKIILKGEAGGMLEIWARAYKLTGDARYSFLAECYSHYSDLEKLEKGEDALTDNHANASIPEAYGAAMMYESTGDEKWLNISKNFWKCAVEDRESYATLGQNAGEFWIPKGHFYEAAGDRDQEFCTMYNMVHMADYLYRFTGEVKYADYIEKALYNGFLAQQNKFTGMPTYFLPMRAGARKTWGSKRNDFWCCHGTMVQAQTVYPSLIYYKDEDSKKVVINQYIPSTGNISVAGREVNITQSLDMNYCQGALFGEGSDGSKGRWFIKINVTSTKEVTLSLRIPAWIGDRKAMVNGKLVDAVDGYFDITGNFDNSDITIALPVSLSEEGLSDGDGVTAVLEGPVVLAAVGDAGAKFSLEGRKASEVLKPFVEHTYDTFPWQQSTYRAYGEAGQTTFMPLYDIMDETYTIYIRK